ncbi:MAG: hypothetical protein HYU26_13155 [Candidatus Rokubacteria bacterium]|nr:hypothetical protein [Candidatus Rokubacteria bacterium]
MSARRRIAVWSAALLLGSATPTSAQLAAAPPVAFPAPAPTPVLGPQELLATRRTPFTFTPTVTLFEEYNDNVFLDNANRQADWITGAAPGFTLDLQGGTYRLAAAYNAVAETYARLTRLNGTFDRQSGVLESMYRPARAVTLTLADTYIRSVETSLVSASGIATGRVRSWANVVTPGAVWELDPRWTLRLTGTYTAERFDGPDLVDSDIYRLTPTVERKLSERITATAGYETGYVVVRREPGLLTHAALLGVVYRLGPTLTGSLRAGPTFELREDGRDRVAPSIRADLRQAFQSGSASLAYERSPGTAGGLGGGTDVDMVTGLLRLDGLLKGLSVEFGPRYTSVRSVTQRASDRRFEAHAWTVGLHTVYRVASWMSLYLGYTFYEQRSNARPAADVDQNRATVGVQFGYPLTRD